MKNFYIDIIQHYQQRITDKSIPVLVRATFKQTVSYYKTELEKILISELNHSQNLLPC
jgi:hypothetical protein